MKRILALALVLILTLGFAACGETENTSSSVFSAAEISNSESSLAESKTESNIDEVSEESTPDTPDFISQFVSIGTVDTKTNASSANSIRLTAIDSVSEFGAITLYTPDYGNVFEEGISECAVAIFDYSEKKFGYVMTEFFEVGKVDSFDVPTDGFAIAAHSYHTAYIDKLSKINEETVFPHGIHLYKGADHKIKKADKAPEIDGKFDKNECKDYKIEDVNSENKSWSYEQFEDNNYYSTATYYTAYDDKYIYLCVVVDSPYHHCPITQSAATDMWQYECIQVKVSSESPDGDYIAENFDHIANAKAANEGIVRSYGFAASDSGETCYYEGGITTEFTGLVACTRDDAAQQTVYEVAIPFAEFEIVPEEGMKLGFTFSINSTNEVDNVWKNVTYRNGGGVIGRNDWTKIPVITLE